MAVGRDFIHGCHLLHVMEGFDVAQNLQREQGAQGLNQTTSEPVSADDPVSMSMIGAMRSVLRGERQVPSPRRAWCSLEKRCWCFQPRLASPELTLCGYGRSLLSTRASIFFPCRITPMYMRVCPVHLMMLQALDACETPPSMHCDFCDDLSCCCFPQRQNVELGIERLRLEVMAFLVYLCLADKPFCE